MRNPVKWKFERRKAAAYENSGVPGRAEVRPDSNAERWLSIRFDLIISA
jgi:hypothetical protein